MLVSIIASVLCNWIIIHFMKTMWNWIYKLLAEQVVVLVGKQNIWARHIFWGRKVSCDIWSYVNVSVRYGVQSQAFSSTTKKAWKQFVIKQTRNRRRSIRAKKGTQAPQCPIMDSLIKIQPYGSLVF